MTFTAPTFESLKLNHFKSFKTTLGAVSIAKLLGDSSDRIGFNDEVHSGRA